ncbi:hypothetical protein [Candidatus Sulfurimonas baltica]|uniref:Uncharacterized protein n=1 Tax=Candidatus Sulfurimonas baltica TaxID=2740404 RepID=A0A7S7LTD0_9BACT|nr:hypothetical protein [Candidatus Sulfurimonas baltica]QOY50915.1 hypothetical protein HUE88_07100 [Candidatus Sulfurimonas baltica]
MNETTLTKLISSYPVAKGFNHLGEKLKGRHYSSGSFITYSILNMMDLKNLISSLTQTECLMLGRYDINQGIIVTQTTYKFTIDKSNVRTRTKSHTYWNKKSVLFFDYDFTVDMNDVLKAENFEALYELILKVLPEFASVEMLFKFSSSSNIYDVNTNTYIGKKIGIHIYFMVDNTSEESIESFKSLLKSRLYELKLAYLEKDKQGKVQEVSLLDFAVFSREREIIESLPLLPPNLSVYTIGNESKIFNEGAAAFDLNSINLDNEYRYEEELEAQKQKIQGDNYVYNTNDSRNTSLYNSINQDVLVASSNERLNYIKVLLKNKNMNYNQITPFFNGEIISMLLREFGYIVNSLKFKLRESERTASTSIRNDNGMIFDFGADFSGTVVKLLMNYHQMNFNNALKYLYICLGADGLNLNEKIYSPLKDPVQVNKNIFTGRVIDLNITVPKVQIYSKSNTKTIPKKSYDLKEIHSQNSDLFRTSGSELDSIINPQLLNNYRNNLDELYPDILGSNSHVSIGYSNDYHSLSVILTDADNELKTIAIRRNNNPKKVESWDKWKKYGSINYIPSRILQEDQIVYVGFGMMEVIVMELLGLSYIVFQSDSVAKKLDKNEQFLKIRNSVNGKKVVLLLDNDEACMDTVKPLRRLLSSASEIVVIKFEKVLNRELEKGYDFVDYINEVSCDVDITKENLINILEKEMI